ncbi:MAG: serine hydrolase [Gemmatimonadota bacterium]|nr:serine hydrolase [Gemmatimonadota bacterium]
MLTLLFTAAAVVLGGNGLPVKKPAAVGMSSARLRTIDHVLNRGIKAGGFPGAAVVVGRKGAAVWEKGFGTLDWSRDTRVSPKQTIYDLASLTKVVGTTTAIMVLFDEGKVALDSSVQSYLPAFQGEGKDRVTVRQLLEHRSGLPADRDLWRMAHSPEEARRAVLETPLVCRPGDCFIYSDLGAATLGMLVEAVSGEGLDQFLAERVFTPLGMTNTFFRPADSLKARIAPTELTPPRGYPLRGEVHDENAYALGGVSGHAGLFSTVSDLSIFAQMMLNGGSYNGTRIISDSTVRIFIRRAAGNRALGWAVADGTGGSGRYLSESAYGHTGYTGTSLWIDPDREMFVILLTNRVHAARAQRPAKVISDIRADLADAAALAVTDAPGQLLAMPASFRADRRAGWSRPQRHHHRRGRHRAMVHHRRSGHAVAKHGSTHARAGKAAHHGASKGKTKAHAPSHRARPKHHR